MDVSGLSHAISYGGQGKEAVVRRALLSLIALLSGAVAVSAGGNGNGMGTFKPAMTGTFNGGLTDRNNAMGFMVGGNLSLLQIGRLRFPSIGIHGGIMDKCPSGGVVGPAGPDGECHPTGAVQMSVGAEFVLDRERDESDRVTREIAFTAGLGQILLGPLSGRDGRNVVLGLTFRYGSKYN